MLWCERQSYNQPYYRGLFAATTLDRVFVTDAFTGTIWEFVDADAGNFARRFYRAILTP